MKNYINFLDTGEEDREHKLNFNNNAISLDSLSNMITMLTLAKTKAS
jgi:hypothetical protein